MEDNQPRLHIKERKEEERVFNGFFKDAFSLSSLIPLCYPPIVPFDFKGNIIIYCSRKFEISELSSPGIMLSISFISLVKLDSLENSLLFCSSTR